MLQIVKSLFSSWNKNEVIYCSWKGNSHLDEAMNGTSDFDILLSEESLEMGTSLLKNAGYMLCITQPEARYPGVQDWIGVDAMTGIMIHIHLHQFMIAGHSGVMEYILPWNEYAFSTRQLDEECGLYQLNPSLEILLLYTRLGIEHSPKKLKKSKGGLVLKEKTKKEVLYLKERMNNAICQKMAKELFPTRYNCLMQILEKNELNSNDLEHLTDLMKDSCSKWLRYNSLKTMLLKEKSKYTCIIRNKWYNGTLRGIYRKIPSSGHGLTVAFVGKDGSGRTMLAKDVLKWLNWKLDANYIYVGDYEITPPHTEISRTRSSEYQKRLNEIGRLIEKGFALAAKGSIILFDRYPLERSDNVSKYPKTDIVIYSNDNIPYEEDLLHVKNIIWEHLNKTEYA